MNICGLSCNSFYIQSCCWRSKLGLQGVLITRLQTNAATCALLGFMNLKLFCYLVDYYPQGGVKDEKYSEIPSFSLSVLCLDSQSSLFRKWEKKEWICTGRVEYQPALSHLIGESLHKKKNQTLKAERRNQWHSKLLHCEMFSGNLYCITFFQEGSWLSRMADVENITALPAQKHSVKLKRNFEQLEKSWVNV